MNRRRSEGPACGKHAVSGMAVILLFAAGCNAGDSAQTDTFDPRIINGSPLTADSAPEVVQLQLSYADTEGTSVRGVCSGTVIGSRAVLTAAHCFVDTPVPFVEGHVASVKGVFQIVAVAAHPEYVFDRQFGPLNDAAVLFTDRDFDIPAAAMLLSHPLEIGDQISVSGFGVTEDGISGELNTGKMTISAVDTKLLHAKFLSQSNTCFGDSGGPAYVSLIESSVPVIAGVISAGRRTDCGIGDEATFTNLADPEIASFILRYVPDGRTE